MTNGFPQNPSPLFTASPGYVVENRITGSQDITSLAQYLNSATTPDDLKQSLSDFHLLCHIRSTRTFSDEEFSRLCKIATDKDAKVDELENMDGWKTLMMVMKEAEGNARLNTPSSTVSRSATNSGTLTPATADMEVSCRHCTFANPPGTVNCEMCGLPLGE